MTDHADRLYEHLLVLRCRAGSRAAFAELVERYQPRLYYFIRKLLGGRAGAEDLLQDVWCAALRGVAGLDELGAFRGWIYRIARDRVFREFRKRRLPLCALAQADLAEGPGDDDAFSAEDAERIHTALDRLATGHREVLVLRFLEDMTYGDIAGVIGCELGTVKSRLYYAKRALRALLEEDAGRA
jgi:RNA polymerase sigma-70 factor (ECF subfamily)